MNTVNSGRHAFEVVDSVPRGYKIWNVGKNMIDGYLPIVQVGGYDGFQVNLETMKAIKIEGAQTILASIGRGQETIKDMEIYIKRYKNSKTSTTQRHVERLQDALQVMYQIKWE